MMYIPISVHNILWCIVLLPHSIADQYIALYDYKPQSDDDLELQENDLIVLLEKSEDGEWCRGKVGERIGWFPTNYAHPADESNLAGDNEAKKMSEGHLFFIFLEEVGLTGHQKPVI